MRMDPNTSKRKRLAWYFKKNAIILVVILLLLVLAFLVAMTSANVYIVVMEGMEARAYVVMNDGDTDELGLYFTDAFIENDPLLKSGKYADYVIGRYTYVSTPSIPICFPWQVFTTVRVSEWIGNIDGELSKDKIAEAGAGTRVPPEWDNGVYDVSLVVEDGKWKIAAVQLRMLVKEPAEDR
jgi:hypothetical protein